MRKTFVSALVALAVVTSTFVACQDGMPTAGSLLSKGVENPAVSVGSNPASLPSCDLAEITVEQVRIATSRTTDKFADRIRGGTVSDEEMEAEIGRALHCAMREPTQAEVEHYRLTHRSTLLAGKSAPIPVCQPTATCQKNLLNDYCGSGSLRKDKNTKIYDEVLSVSQCLNDRCCEHDVCYDNYEVPKACVFSPQTKLICDAALVIACDQMKITQISGTLPVQYDISIGSCCDRVESRQMRRSLQTCSIIRFLDIDTGRDQKKCESAGGLPSPTVTPAPTPPSYVEIIATNPFPIRGDVVYLFPIGKTFVVDSITEQWICNPLLGSVGFGGYLGTNAGIGAPAPDAPNCSLIGCLGNNCTPSLVLPGSVFTRVGQDDYVIYMGINEKVDALSNNSGSIKLYGHFF